MEKNTRFYVCHICEKLIGLIHDTGVPTMCCGKEMELLEANTTDASVEKHVPAYEVDEQNGEIIVKVGDVEHPMDKEHYIMWIAQVADNTTTRVRLLPEQAAMARMQYIKGATLFAYCNKHGLWKTEVD